MTASNIGTGVAYAVGGGGAGGAAGGFANHTHAVSPTPNFEAWLGGNQTGDDGMSRGRPSHWLLRQLMIRLRVDPGTLPPFDFIGVHQVSDQKFIVFVVNKGEPVTIEDGALFPSDTLITQLRLLKESNK